MRAEKSVRLSVTQEKLVWAANMATTQARLEAEIKNLEAVNKNTVMYLRAIPAANLVPHSHFKEPTLRMADNEFRGESEQAKSLKLKPRMMIPFECLKSYATILMGNVYALNQHVQL